MLLKDILKKKAVKGDVGVEIECEGANFPYVELEYWTATHDGSLRNGIEFVYKKPLPLSEVEKSLDYLNEEFAKSETKLDFSFRTSVHVHVNCLDMEYNHILNYIYTYLLLETILVDYCGEGRKCNRFCLRMEDADGAIEQLTKLFASTGTFRVIDGIPLGSVRYASINVEALKKFGTLEFRAMRGIVNKEILLPWIQTLVNLREFSKRFESPKSIYFYLNEVGSREFFLESVGEHHKLFDNGNVEESIARNLSLSIDLPFTEVKPEPKMYRVGGGEYSIEFLLEHFNGDIPDHLRKEILRQDPNAPVAPVAIDEWDAVAYKFDALVDELQLADGDEEPEDEDDLED